MNKYEYYVKIVLGAMVAVVFVVGFTFSLSGVIGTPWKWLMCAESVIGVILLIMCGHFADRLQAAATLKNIDTERQ